MSENFYTSPIRRFDGRVSIRPRCHPQSHALVTYDPATEKLILICSRCDREYAEFEVAKEGVTR